jgi:hypothetical protein
VISISAQPSLSEKTMGTKYILAFSGIKYETIAPREAGDRFQVCIHWYLNENFEARHFERARSSSQSISDFQLQLG